MTDPGSGRSSEDVVRAAVRAFGDKGYAATTLEGIARRVGLTRQGVLHYFPSKEALFVAVIADQDRWAREQYSQHDPQETADHGLRGLQVLLPFLGKAGLTRHRVQMVHVLHGEALSGNKAARAFATHRQARVLREISDRISRSRRAGEVRADVDTADLATLLSAAINGLQSQWLLDETVDTQGAFALLLRLVSTSPTSTDPPSDD